MTKHQHYTAPKPTGSKVKESKPPGPAGLQYAGVQLHPADATEVLQAKLPGLLKILSKAQVTQVQRVFNAAVLNPVVLKEAQKLHRQATRVMETIVVTDEKIENRARRVMKNYIYVNEADQRIRLNYSDLIESDALAPRTDNPDEAVYLKRVQATLANKGVYLRLAMKLVRDPEDPSRRIYDPRQWETWLSLGPDGDTIPTAIGRITRENLLNTTVLGAGYYTNVHQGPSQRLLEKRTSDLDAQITSGFRFHQQQEYARNTAAPGVVPISDKLGGADYPSIAIWDGPKKLLIKSIEFNEKGNILASSIALVAAANLTLVASALLEDYYEKMEKGVSRAVTIAKVVKVTAEVLEAVLSGYGVVAAARGGAVVATEVGAETAAERWMAKQLAKEKALAEELGYRGWVKMPKGTTSSGINNGTGAGQGFHTGY